MAAQDIWFITEATKQAIQRLLGKEKLYDTTADKVKGLRGYGITNTPWALTIGIPQPRNPQPNSSTTPPFLVYITDTSTYQGGFYIGTAKQGTMSSADPTANLSLPAGLTDGQQVIVVNPEENGLPTHWIAPDTYVECDWDGATYTNGGTTYPLVRVSGSPVYNTDSPSDLTTTPGTPTDADTHSWGRNVSTSGDVYGDSAVTIKFESREPVDSDPDGDGVITKYGFFRTMNIDAGGRVIAISAETQVTLATSKPACPS